MSSSQGARESRNKEKEKFEVYCKNSNENNRDFGRADALDVERSDKIFEVFLITKGNS